MQPEEDAGTDVGLLSELVEGVPKAVRAAGREIVLVRWRGNVFALRNICPHQSASFERGFAHAHVGGARASARGAPTFDFVFDDETPVMQCPVHKWEFRLTDGRCATDDRFRVRAYPVRVLDDRIFVETTRQPTIPTGGDAAAT